MNVLECQAVGTPVVTTKFMAMEDYTKLGISVPHRQMLFDASLGNLMAMPDVPGLVDALSELHADFRAALGLDDSTGEAARAAAAALTANMAELAEATGQWIEEKFSAARVGRAFRDLIEELLEEFDEQAADHARNYDEEEDYDEDDEDAEDEAGALRASQGGGALAVTAAPPSFAAAPLFTFIAEDAPRIVDWDMPWVICVPARGADFNKEAIQ